MTVGTETFKSYTSSLTRFLKGNGFQLLNTYVDKATGKMVGEFAYNKYVFDAYNDYMKERKKFGNYIT